MLIGNVINNDNETIGYLVTSPATGATICIRCKDNTFNGNYSSPTFEKEIVTDKNGHHDHFMIINGMFHYNEDCDHDKKGTIMKMVDIDDGYDFYSDKEETE